MDYDYPGKAEDMKKAREAMDELAEKQKIYADASACVNRLNVEPCVEAPFDTSDKIRAEIDMSVRIAVTLVNVLECITFVHRTLPVVSEPTCLLHGLAILREYSDFILDISEEIRVAVR